MNNLPPNYCIVDKEEFQGMVKNQKEYENQMNILMDLMKIPKENRNFLELRNKIAKIMGENEPATNLIDDNQYNQYEDSIIVSPMENILNNPGLIHLAEKIFWNLSFEDLKECRLINQS